eukprot:gnl/TRDRNA2_/TRDRNA2_177330_c7_seq8.p1 gnl/TRDRNA2_/TRDRNA2_177330_c7~~gnl/TRDRNA2_/TRDRNA2_177330_c7_seq8.p1  ORF type:complete len:359 (-),score=44.21 gnl/TRDRNA2_/TRDRNA2_177330_c7_seq8:216-1142(-)
MPPNGGVEYYKTKKGEDEKPTNLVTPELCDATNWRQYWVLSSNGTVLRNPVINKCVTSGRYNRYASWGDCTDFPPKYGEYKGYWRLKMTSYVDRLTNGGYKMFNLVWGPHTPHRKNDNVLIGENSYRGEPLQLTKVANPRGPWAPPPGKMLFLGQPLDSYDLPLNHLKCITAKAEKVYLIPCEWLDKNIYWEQLPGGQLKSVATGKCIARSATEKFAPIYHQAIVLDDCSSPAAGVLTRHESPLAKREADLAVIFTVTKNGKTTRYAMQEVDPDKQKDFKPEHQDRPVCYEGNPYPVKYAQGQFWFFS